MIPGRFGSLLAMNSGESDGSGICESAIIEPDIFLLVRDAQQEQLSISVAPNSIASNESSVSSFMSGGGGMS
jgi:hypothetical protein